MEPTPKQERAIDNDRDEDVDFSPWTNEEIDLLAAETADLLAGDGWDEPEDV